MDIIGFMVIAIVALILGTKDGWSEPGAGNYLRLTATLMAAALIVSGLTVLVDDIDGIRILSVFVQVLMAVAVLILVRGAVDAKRASAGNPGTSAPGF